jgi:hypothetical protein
MSTKDFHVGNLVFDMVVLGSGMEPLRGRAYQEVIRSLREPFLEGIDVALVNTHKIYFGHLSAMVTK